MTESFYLSELWKVGRKWIGIIEVKIKGAVQMMWKHQQKKAYRKQRYCR